MSIIERAVARLKHDEPHAADPPVEPSRPAAAPKRVLPPDASEAFESGAAPLRDIDLARLKVAGMITPDGEKTQLSEEFRAIKRPLINNAFARGANQIANGNLIMVTSALPHEGKTFCAVNLAMSIALERDHTVLLVDADVAKRRGKAFLGLAPGKGLMDLLLDKDVRFNDVLLRTNVEKLNVVLAGRSHPHATEVLASETMSRLLNEMARRYPDRIIIFDAPPLLMTTEASALAQRMGQIVLVIEAGKTPQAAVKEALPQISGCQVFALLNKGHGALGDNPFTYGAYSYASWRS